MIRQARRYLLGAVSGATLIAIAIGVFVVLVSAQVFHDWPLAALGDEGSAVAPSRPVAGGEAVKAAAIAAGTAARRGGADAGAPRRDRSRGDRETAGGSVAAALTGAGSTETGGGAEAGAGSPASTPAAGPSPSPASGGAAGSAGGGNAPPAGSGGAGDGSGGGSGSAPGATAPDSGDAGPGGGSGGSAGASGNAASTAGAVAETVNGTVAQVDEKALGGALGKAGVTEVTESVVDGVAGPESTVGKVVDETVKAVGGLLGGKR